jgi:uncharacterized protein YjbI with pentapeptide repeats
MQTKNATDVLFVTTVTSRKPPAPELVLIAKAKLDLIPNAPMTIVDGLRELAQGPLNHDVFADADEERQGELLTPSDFAEFKPHGEVVLTGSCHAPRSRFVSELPVRVRVGRWSKSLKVIGDRLGRRDEPKPFCSMPLDYAHAFGGPSFPANPVGKGHEAGGQPNVIDPTDDKNLPGSFGPLSPSWSQRAARLGKRYDQDYLDKRFPFYPEDFDWRHFQAAQANQWIDGFWRGDEKVTLDNLHPELELLETQLPGIRIRAFVNDDGGKFREAKMVLDTIVIDTDSQTATLTWRGQTPIRKLLATDVKTVLVVQEALADKPGSEEDYRRQLEAFEADPLEVDSYLPAEMKQKLAELEDKSESDLMGTTEEGRAMSKVLRKKMGKSDGDIQAKLVARVDESSESSPEARDYLRNTIAAMEAADDSDDDEIPPYMPIAPGARPRVYIRKSLEVTKVKLAEGRARLVAMRRQADEAQRKVVDEQLAVIDENASRIDDPQLKAVDPTLREISDGTPGPGADLSGQDLSERDLRGVDLRGAKLDGAILTKANLRGVDMTGASLQGTVLYRADLTECVLRDADLSQCNAANALLEDADLSGCKVFEAYFKDAKMSRCNLSKVSGRYAGFPGADLTAARLTDAKLEDAHFQDTTLIEANLSRAVLTKAFCLDAKASSAVFDGAQLDQTCFLSCDLSHASLVGATGERTSFMRAKLDKAKFTKAVLPSAFFDDCRASGASFFGADLREARFLRADLDGSRFDQANLFSADLCDAEVHDVTFRNANLYDAKLLRTGGTNCDFSGANLELTRSGGRI